jgi:RNA polymerase sigma factor (TIGR02999 family)
LFVVFYYLPGASDLRSANQCVIWNPKPSPRFEILFGDSFGAENPPDKTFDSIGREAMIISVSQVTQLLDAIESGDPAAAGHLLPLVYEELRKLAAAKMAQEKPGQTLQPTALVHEAWLRLAGSEQRWNGRDHFFGAAAEAMRRILVDRARKKSAERHGGQRQRVDLEHVTLATEDSDETVLAIHEALEKLAMESPQKAEIVKLHYFADMKYAEIAQTLGLSLATVERHWAYARSWLYRELKQNLSNR